MSRQPVIIDCDPGHDDAIAILLALSHPQLEVKAITTVHGNQTLPKVTDNALRLLTAIGRTDIPVAAGCARPLVAAPVTAPEIHGESGLDGPNMPEPAFRPLDEHAVNTIIRILRTSDRKVTLIPTGPLTNIAAALLKAPDIMTNIEHIYLMGGAIHEGNKTPVAEFNIYVDPHAAKVVFTSGLPITMIGLDVTHQARMGEEEIARLRAMDRPVAHLVADLITFFMGTYRRVFGFDYAPLHDAVAVAQAIAPGIVATRRLHVDVETTSPLTFGQTIVDLYGVTGREPNANVGFRLDRDAFLEMLMAAIATY
ncbi:MAG: nucleoside hydrolase [Hydrogenibacillus sp.]|nr:nucleoside hydrolase [Hydrogenibacillus sp.]